MSITEKIQLHVVNDGRCAACNDRIDGRPIVHDRWPSDVGPALAILTLYHRSCVPVEATP